MKKICLLLFSIVNFMAWAQPFAGAHYTSNDAIITQTINPAFPSASDVKWQVNLMGFDMSLGNNYFALKGSPKDLIRNFDVNTSLTEILDGKRKNMFVGLAVQGPSFMLKIKNNAINVGSRARAILTFNDLNQDLIYSLYHDFNQIQNWIGTFNDERLTGAANVYHEIYGGYSRAINLKPRHSLHVGANVKVVTNIFNAQVAASDVNFNKIVSGVSDTFINMGNTKFDFLVSDAIDDGFNYKFNVSGWGLDFGLIYEFKKKNSKEHFIMAGISVVDIGTTKYTLGKNSRTFVGNNTNVPLENLVDASSGDNINIDAMLDSLGTVTTPTGKKITKMPTVINAFVDVQVVPKFYVNGNFQFNPYSFKKGDPKANMPNDITITPRFETRIFSAFAPLNWNKYEGINFGAGIRVAQFTLGSKNIITAFAKKKFTGVNFYMNIGFGKVSKKDKQQKKVEEPTKITEEQKLN